MYLNHSSSKHSTTNIITDTPKLTTMDPHAGMIWKRGFFGGLELKWTTDPSLQIIEEIVRRELSVPKNSLCKVQSLAQGAFNKVYAVQRQGPQDEELIMRITLPVQPYFKTISEHATIEYLKQHTTIPVPEVLKYNAKREAELGFEWMIMHRVHGVGLGNQWTSMSWLKKELIVRKVVSFLVQLFKTRFPRIGNLYEWSDLQRLQTSDLPEHTPLGYEHSTKETTLCLSQVVSIPFFLGKHATFDIQRGPYTNSRAWLAAQLQLYIKGADDPILYEDSGTDSDDDPDEFATPEAIKSRANRLIALLPTVFPEGVTEEFVLHHGDLNENNIMVDHLNHEITGVIDWECVHTVPLWQACQIPKFLNTNFVRNNVPMPEMYSKDEQDDGTFIIDDSYFEDCLEYEKTQLRRFFLEEMARVCPEWVAVHKSYKLQAAFGEVVLRFGDEGLVALIDTFITRVEENGDSESIREMIRGDDL